VIALVRIVRRDKVSDALSAAPANLLVLCSGNQCRSPMAEALLIARLGGLRIPVEVRSAGLIHERLLQEGEPPPPGAISALASFGLDISGHRSRRVTVTDLSWAGLVLGMAREHLRHAVVTVPDTWPRAFTLKELVRRGEEIGPAKPAEPLADWLDRVHEGRERAALLGDSPVDDMADPMGGPPRAYADTAALLDELTGQLAGLCWGLSADRLPGER
jgi:protein-tyrosine phosphatase